MLSSTVFTNVQCIYFPQLIVSLITLQKLYPTFNYYLDLQNCEFT